MGIIPVGSIMWSVEVSEKGGKKLTNTSALFIIKLRKELSKSKFAKRKKKTN